MSTGAFFTLRRNGARADILFSSTTAASIICVRGCPSIILTVRVLLWVCPQKYASTLYFARSEATGDAYSWRVNPARATIQSGKCPATKM
jgi:hypothetical protein